ncbi:MAG: hypothetical protein H0V44_02815 [Planctomycetes bacterium]|nr:hypothetical protein [Planctomycetota bacterium]
MRRIIIVIIVLINASCAWSADDAPALRQRVAELEREIAELKAATVSYEALNRAKLRIHASDASSGTDLPASIVALLGLSGDQVVLVSAARAHAKERTNTALLALKQRPLIDGRTLTLTIPDFSAQGKPVKEELDRTLTGILGEPRRIFMNSVMEHLDERAFSSFGACETTVTLTTRDDGMFDYRLSHKLGTGTNISSGNSRGLPSELAILASSIPKRFGGTLPDVDDGSADHGPAKDF